MNISRIVTMYCTDIQALSQSLFQEIVFVMTEASHISSLGIAYQRIVLYTQLPHGHLQCILQFMRISIKLLAVRALETATSHHEFLVQHQGISRHAYASADIKASGKNRSFFVGWNRIIKEHDISPLHLFGHEMRSSKRYTPPIAPLVHQHLFALIEGVLHTGRRDGARGYGKRLDQ